MDPKDREIVKQVRKLPKARLSQADIQDIHQVVQQRVDSRENDSVRDNLTGNDSMGDGRVEGATFAMEGHRRSSRRNAGLGKRARLGKSVVQTTATAVAGLIITAGCVLYIVDPNVLPMGIFQTATAPPSKTNVSTDIKPSPSPNSVRIPFRQSSQTLNGVVMFVHSSGWLKGKNGRLLHTDDNGLTWINVSPRGGSQGQTETVSVLDGQTACVAVGNIQGKQASTTLYLTQNGGQTWTKHVFTKNSPGSTVGQVPVTLTMVDSKQLWMATQVPDFGMGGTTPGALYRTQDGGATWHEVSAHVEKNVVSFAWLEFLTPKTGFTVGAKQSMQADTGATDGNPDRLYETHDGGRSWKLANITLPSGRFVSVLKPTFFSEETGVLPVMVRRPGGLSTLMLYSTADGGVTWQCVGRRGLTASLMAVDFTSVKNGYLLDGTRLYHSADGGAHWEPVGTAPSVVQSGNVSIQFTDERHGWLSVGGNLWATPSTAPIVVYRTVDGGRTWKAT